MFHLYILLDNILVALFASIVGFVGILIIVMTEANVYFIIIIIFMCLNLIIMAGTFRILLVYCYWKTWHIISGKLCILLSCGAYLIIAADIILNGFPNSDMMSS